MTRDRKDGEADREDLLTRRDALASVGRWSKIVIGGALGAAAFGAMAKDANAAVWGNGGRSWANRRGGGGWVNNRGGGGSWVNRRGLGGWINHR